MGRCFEALKFVMDIEDMRVTLRGVTEGDQDALRKLGLGFGDGVIVEIGGVEFGGRGVVFGSWGSEVLRLRKGGSKVMGSGAVRRGHCCEFMALGSIAKNTETKVFQDAY